jgi:hypothetical protein|tara:strand:+ start:1676 stop:1792 length:117 start_codon:yes stop_codon:yes gene_type:complete
MDASIIGLFAIMTLPMAALGVTYYLSYISSESVRDDKE